MTSDSTGAEPTPVFVFAAAFLAAAPLITLVVPTVFLAAFFLAVAFFLTGGFFAAALRAAGFFTDGPAARRSANKSDARSIEIVSTESPPRSEALVSPSVM